jgi:hypothetical protein
MAGRTSFAITLISSHINRGNMFFKNGRLRSDSWISSSASRGCRGKDAGFVLQVLMAQVRKLSVRSFILDVCALLVVADCLVGLVCCGFAFATKFWEYGGGRGLGWGKGANVRLKFKLKWESDQQDLGFVTGSCGHCFL